MSPTYYNYPTPITAPLPDSKAAKYENVPANNPTLAGIPLRILSRVVEYVGPLQRLLWQNAHFGSLRSLRVLEAYQPRFDPAVIPIEPVIPSKVPVPVNSTPSDGSRKVDTTFYTTADYVAAYTSQKFTPTDVTEYLLTIIQEPPHKLAFIQIIPELALQAAQESTTRYQNGTQLGPLDGIPIAVKDEVDIHGYMKTFGSSRTFDLGQGETSWGVKKLQEAGAIIIGKTNMHELGTDTTNNNPFRGTPRNPYNGDYYTGGSSGGSAYVVGSGLVPIAVGADGGGSIRIPAAYCGVYGLKPSHGRISARPSVSLTPSNGVKGPIASSLQDLALAYRVMATPDPLHPSSSAFPSPCPPLTPTSPPATKVIGIYHSWFNDCSATVSALCNQAVGHLTAAGYELVELPQIPYLNEARLAHALSIVTDMSIFLGGNTSQLNPANKILRSVASQTPAADYAAAQKVRAMMMSHFAALWQQYPGMIIVTPTTPHAGVKIRPGDLPAGVSDTNTSLASMRYVFLANFIGTPSLCAGVGYEQTSGMPVSLMGLAEWGHEEDLLGWGADVAQSLEVLGEGRRRGETWVDVLGGVGVVRSKL